MDGPGLLVWMSFFKEKIARNNCKNEQSSADKVGEKVGKLGKEPVRREERGEVLSWFSKASTNRGYAISNGSNIFVQGEEGLRPTIVPIDHTKGITAYARARN